MSSPERQFRDHQGQMWGVRIEVLVPKIFTTVAGGDRGMGIPYISPVFLKAWSQTSSISIAWNFLDMHIHPRPTESEILGVGSCNLIVICV